MPQRPGPAAGSGRRINAEQSERLVSYRLEHPSRGYHYCRHELLHQGLAAPAAATIGRVWRRAGLLQPLAERGPRPRTRWVPPRPQRPGHVQIDVKYLPGGRYEYTCIDVYSRYVYARVYGQLNAWQANEFLLELLAALPFRVSTIQTDGGGEFKAEFTETVHALKLNKRLNAPHCPWQNGFVERFHRTVAEEFYLWLSDEIEEIRTSALDAALQDYLHEHNHRRLHSTLGYRAPAMLIGTVSEKVYPQIPRRCPTKP